MKSTIKAEAKVAVEINQSTENNKKKEVIWQEQAKLMQYIKTTWELKVLHGQ